MKLPNVLILGLGTSGEHAARLAHTRGAYVTVYDDKRPDELAAVIQRLADCKGITYRLAEPVDPTSYDVVVRSPGITNEHPVLAAARQAHMPVWSELELAWRSCPCPAIAITGTNGKGTTTTLAADILRAAGHTVHVAGNIGTPLAEIIPTMAADDIAVLEVSHVQLEDSPTLAPRTAVITNIRPEHGALYPFDYYQQLKARIVANHTATDTTVIDYDDELVHNLVAFVPGPILYTRLTGPLPAGLNGVYVQDDCIQLVIDGLHTPLCSLDDLQVRGALPNLLQAAAAVHAWGASATDVRQAAQNYRGREHVMEAAGVRNGVAYYNDAKATNPYSVIHALRALSQPTILIAGGKDDKGADFKALGPHLTNVSHVVAFGPTAEAVATAVHDAPVPTPTTLVDDFLTAVQTAQALARPGDAVLLSPGTHSWNMEPGYLDRGTIFKELAQNG